MGDQNIYDNPVFFEGYRRLRENPLAANTVIEKPALFSLCPDFAGQAVLDLGCGCGENCRTIAEAGAKAVVGVDISQKMLAVAKAENTAENVRFVEMSMTDLSGLQGRFDVILSSLAVHYIEDFGQLLGHVYRLLAEDGLLVFSQEHPLTTALTKDDYWHRDENGVALHYKLTDYGRPGVRQTNWIVEGVVKYHRTFGDIVNALTASGFVMEAMLEPMPEEAVMKQDESYRKYYHKPDFLLIRARKA